MAKVEKACRMVMEIGLPPEWEDLPPKNGDDQRMQLRLVGFAINPADEKDQFRAEFVMQFTRTLIQSGRNAGKTCIEANSDLCCRLGMAQPFNPQAVGELQGVEVEAVFEEEEYKGRTEIRWKYINPVRQVMDARSVAAKWAAMTGKKAGPVAAPAKAAPKASPKPAAGAGTPDAKEADDVQTSEDPIDQLPF